MTLELIAKVTEGMWFSEYGFKDALKTDVVLKTKENGVEYIFMNDGTKRVYSEIFSEYLKKAIADASMPIPGMEPGNHFMTMAELDMYMDSELCIRTQKHLENIINDDAFDHEWVSTNLEKIKKGKPFVLIERCPKYELLSGKHVVLTINSVFHPAQKITQDVVSECVSLYAADHLKVPDVRVVFNPQYDKTRTEKKYAEYLAFVDSWRTKKRVVTLSYSPARLAELVPPEEWNEFTVPIRHGFERDGVLYVELNDGTQCPLEKSQAWRGNREEKENKA